MYSCEDATGGADGRGTLAGVGAQVMGPGDGYLCRHARDVAPFWAWKHRLGLGHAFATSPGAGARCAKHAPRGETRALTRLAPQRRRWGRCRRRRSPLTWRRASRPPPRGTRRVAHTRCSVSVSFAALTRATVAQGSVRADDRTAGPGPPGTASSCAWAYAVQPRFGWGGGADATQKATAGWLAALPVFEPHWQARVPMPAADVAATHAEQYVMRRC